MDIRSFFSKKPTSAVHGGTKNTENEEEGGAEKENLSGGKKQRDNELKHDSETPVAKKKRRLRKVTTNDDGSDNISTTNEQNNSEETEEEKKKMEKKSPKNKLSKKRTISDSSDEEGDVQVRKSQKVEHGPTASEKAVDKMDEDDEIEDEDQNVKKLKTMPSPTKKSKRQLSSKEESKDEEAYEEEDEDEEDEDDDEILSDAPTPKKSSTVKSSKSSSSAVNSISGSSKYDVIKEAGWEKGKPVPYVVLTRAFAKIEEISGRLKTIEIMSDLFRSVIALSPKDLIYVVYLCVNKIAPPYENLEVGVGDSLLYKAIELSTGRKTAHLKAVVEEVGDLGIVAEQSRGKQKTMFKPKPLTCEGVFRALRSLSEISGNKSRDKKIGIINKMFVASREAEARYIVRSLQGKMRIGFSEQSVLVALGRAVAFTPTITNGEDQILNMSKTLSRSKFASRIAMCEQTVKEAYSEVPNWEKVIGALVDHGVENLSKKCFLTPGIPIKAMLAKPTKGIQEVLKRFANMKFTLEYKYDGERIQIHLLSDGTLIYFSRNAENTTEKFPDITKFLPKAFDSKVTTSFIIDCEVVAFDRKKDAILPFQTLSTRKRKDVQEDEITVQVALYAFDCLYLNGKSLLKEPFSVRRQHLHDTFTKQFGEFYYAEFKDTNDPEDIQIFLDKAINSSCEGLMVKTLDVEASYEPSKRSHSWLKVKKDYLSGAGDTLDLVPIGGYYGKGKRTGVYGAYLVACFDDDSEDYQAITKIGTGLKDDFLASSSSFFHEGHILKEPPRYYKLPESETDVPDDWFEPCQVWEVKCADLSISPKYLAAVGLVHESKGIALRFPRLIRIRDDKNPEDATSAEQVAEMYQNQFQSKE